MKKITSSSIVKWKHLLEELTYVLCKQDVFKLTSGLHFYQYLSLSFKTTHESIANKVMVIIAENEIGDPCSNLYLVCCIH